MEVPFQQVATGLRFPEGPIALDDGSVLLVEIERRTLSRVDTDGKVEVVAECGGGPNGAAFGPDGKVYVCNNGGFEWHDIGGLLLPGDQPDDYIGGRIQRVDIETGEVEDLYTEVNGIPLKGPNDIVFDPRGGFWFTDLGKTRPRDRDIGGLYWAKDDGSEVREVVHPVGQCNGVGLSPELDRVYVAETDTGRVWWWQVKGPGEVEPNPVSRNGANLLVGVPGFQLFDSLAVDGEGNVCVATLANGGITIVSPDGASAEHVPFPDPLVTNICFGGDDLRTAYVTCSGFGTLVAAEWPTPGLRLAHGPP